MRTLLASVGRPWVGRLAFGNSPWWAPEGMPWQLKGNARTVGLAMLAVLVLVLAIFLVISWTQGDPTNHRGDHHQPDMTPSPTFPTGTSSP